MSSTVCPRTFTKHQSCANPLFERWLDEWRAEAQEKNSDLQYCYTKVRKEMGTEVKSTPSNFHVLFLGSPIVEKVSDQIEQR